MNLMYGRRLYGRYIYAYPVIIGSGEEPSDTSIKFLPGIFTVIAYNKDGTKTAVFGNGADKNTIKSLSFELIETGCGAFTITFNKLPTTAELNYRQRIDIFLFNDSRPWYSGYVIERPVEGTTETEFKFTGYGYYNLLDKVYLFETYINKEVSQIVKDIAKKLEAKTGLAYNTEKIINTGYTIDTITFDGVNAKDALSDLSEFAIDYVYGVDARRSLYFKPRVAEINEQARFWVGKHLDSYVPSWDVDKIINWAKIKGATDETNTETWLATVEDTDSQELYGMCETVLTLPTFCSTTDAAYWGQNQVDRYKSPLKSAKVKNLRLIYPKADGSFSVRKLTTDGLMAIYPTTGDMQTYPITKLKYTVSADKGIYCEAEVGEQPTSADVNAYLGNLERKAKNAELLASASS